MTIKKLTGKIVKIHDLTEDVRNFFIDLGENFDFKAGQFINLSFNVGDQVYRKPYSIASHPEGSSVIELCIKLVPNGKTTPKLWEKKIGDEVNIMGPLGLFSTQLIKKDKLVFIGTGTGIAPLRSMIKHLLKNETDKEITLIKGSRFEHTILFEKEFDFLQKTYPHFKFVKTVSRPSEDWNHRKGYVHHNFDVIDINNSQAFICGLPEMVEDSIKKLKDLGMDEKVIHMEKYH